MSSLIKNKTLKSSINLILVLFSCFFCNFALSSEILSDKEILDIKNEAFALYSTDNKKEALRVLERIPQNRRDEDIFVIIGNIYDDMDKRGEAIENYNKVYRTKFLISQATFEMVQKHVDVIKIREVTIRGKAKKINIYEVLRLINV